MNLFATTVSFHADYVWSWLLLYIGPDVFLPLTSAIAAMAGFLLMFWQRVVGVVMRLFGKNRSSAADAEASRPDVSGEQQKTS